MNHGLASKTACPPVERSPKRTVNTPSLQSHCRPATKPWEPLEPLSAFWCQGIPISGGGTPGLGRLVARAWTRWEWRWGLPGHDVCPSRLAHRLAVAHRMKYEACTNTVQSTRKAPNPTGPPRPSDVPLSYSSARRHHTGGRDEG